MAKALIIQGANFTSNALEQITLDITHATAISVSPASVSLTALGATNQLSATLTPSDAQDAILWESSDTDVCTVSSSGLVTSVGVGTCTITATAGTVSYTCTVTATDTLTDFDRILHGRISSGTASNRVTVIDTSAAGYKSNLIAMVSEDTFNNLIVTNNFTKVENGVYSVMDGTELSESSDANVVRIYNTMGYPTPISLPSGCTKIQCNALDAHYGVYPLFFQKNVSAYPNPSSTDEWKAHFSPYRDLQTITDSWTYTYEQTTEIDVPAGYDSVVIMWHSDTSNGGMNFTDMTEAQLATFTITCM